MKKFIASAGLAAVGATGLQAAYAPNLTPMETSKPWSIAASVRGFYDDNYNTAPKNAPAGSPTRQDSFGIEFSPSAAINIPLEQTYLGASYVYSLRYYDDRPENSVDHSHEINLKLDHKFSERYRVRFDDSFAYSQEPEIIQGAGTAAATFVRTDSEALRNRARLDFTAQLTELLSVEPGYSMTWYDFLDEGPGSRSALLDRVEHLLHIDALYQIQEHLQGGLGYAFGVRDYTSDELISPGLTGDDRDSQFHQFYGRADYAFSSQLNGSARVGVEYTSYDTLGGDELSPFFDLSAAYTYLQNSYAQLGVRHTRNAVDVGDAKDQESTLVYASVNHRVSREITASLLGHYQYGEFNGGSLDGEVDNAIWLGLNLEYRITPNWAVDAGYNWDRLDSDAVFRSYTRNRIYVGASATF
jgi:outer membrane scaffolding protein for murein synthesis (MipA/OmpV family)